MKRMRVTASDDDCTRYDFNLYDENGNFIYGENVPLKNNENPVEYLEIAAKDYAKSDNTPAGFFFTIEPGFLEHDYSTALAKYYVGGLSK